MKIFYYLVQFCIFSAGVVRCKSLFSSETGCLVREDKLIDLTHPFDESTLGWPAVKEFMLNVLDNGTTDDGYWLQQENYESGIHTGTHIDAPCHIQRGQWTLDQIPINRFIAPATVVDITPKTIKNRDTNLEVDDLERWEEETGRTLDSSIVLVRTGWDTKWHDREEFLGTTSTDVRKVHFPGISPEADQWLANNRKVYGVGIDTASLDNGQAIHRKAHEALFAENIYGLENVANLYKLPPFGAELYVFPMKITGSSGAPVRIIAYLP